MTYLDVVWKLFAERIHFRNALAKYSKQESHTEEAISEEKV